MERMMNKEETKQTQALISKSEMEILELRALALSRPLAGEEGEGELLRLLAFPLGNERYAVEIDLVQEVQPLKPKLWSPVPCTPPFIVGAVNIRGRIYSVMDIARFLGLSSRPLSETAHILLVRSEKQDGELELCILSDALPKVTSIHPAALQSPSNTVTNQIQDLIRGVTDDMLVILDLERLLLDPRIIVHDEV
jgi:purine-binding chemotaxis protein CheW